MEIIGNLESIIERYFSDVYKLYKPNDANGVSIKQSFMFDSRADFLKSYLDFYRNLGSLKEAIEYGCSAKFKIRYQDEEYELKHTHQEEFVDEKGKKRGVNNSILNNMKSKLLFKEKELQSASSFEEVYNIIKSVKVAYFGELSIYDAAVRISSYLGIVPDKVYLHAGARDGAKHLESKGLLPIDASIGRTISIQNFPDSLQKLDVLQIENLLCAFKIDLKKLINSAP